MNTERHPLALLTREVRPVPLDARRTVLVLQDLHAPFSDVDNGWLAREALRKVVSREFDEYLSMVPGAVANAGKLLAAARDVGLTVHFACFGHRSNDEPSPLQRSMGWTWNIDGPDGVFPDEVRPVAMEALHAKPGWGILGSKSIRMALRTSEAATVLLAGLPFDFGVRQTCLELADAGYCTLLASDATASLTHAAEGPARGNLAHGATKLRSTEEILGLLARVGGEKVVWV